jgi:hypothetical protein
VKIAAMRDTTHNPFNEIHWVSCLRENLTSSSYGEGLETDRAVTQVPRQSFTRQNANNNVLKTTGYHVEHNFGHGQHYLSAVMLSLNLLAFLFHTVLEWSDDKYALLRQVLARRQTFFHDIQALMRYLVFDSWDHLMDFMIRGLELESQCDSS